MPKTPIPTGDEIAERITNLSLVEAEYPSISPPDSARSPSYNSFSSGHTPAGRVSFPYSPFPQGNTLGEYSYYPANQNIATLHPPFPPVPNGVPPTTAYTFDHLTGQQLAREPLMDSAFHASAEPFSPMQFNQDTRRGRGRGGTIGGPGVYRPPHLQQQQQQQQALLQQQQNQEVAVMQQYYNLSGTGQMWWPPQPMGTLYTPASGGSGGERKKDQATMGLQSTNLSYPSSRNGHSVQPLFSPSSNSYFTGSEMNPSLTGYPNNPGLMTPQAPPYRSTRGGHLGARGRGGVSRAPMYPHTPYTPGRQGSGLQVRRMQEEPVDNIPRSALLEDFRLNKVNRRFDVLDVYGHIIEFSCDQHGSRFVQQKLETGTGEDRQRIFDEILPNAFQIMTDVYGNYVIQKMFELGDQWQNAALVQKMEGNVLVLSMQMYGCRVVQKALEHALVEQREKIVSELEPHILDCVRNGNANHVVQRLVMIGPPQSVPDAFLGHISELSADPYGCRVIQKMIETLPDEMIRELLNEIHPHVFGLMQDPFANYVIQSIIVSGTPADRDRVIGQIKGQMTPMSRHKFGSNVCEKALQHATVEDRRILVEELIDAQPDGTNQVGMLLRDAFGNFPIQTALTFAEDDQRAELLDLIIPHIPSIRQIPVGKRLEARLAQWEADGLIASATEVGANMAAYRNAQASSGMVHHRDSFSSSTSDDSSSKPQSMSASSSTGATSPSYPQIDKNLRSTASTPIRGPMSSHARKGLEKSDSVSTLKDRHDDRGDREHANDEATLESLLH